MGIRRQGASGLLILVIAMLAGCGSTATSALPSATPPAASIPLASDPAGASASPAASPAGASPVHAGAALLRVQVAGLRLREAPGTDAAEVAKLPAGAHVSRVGGPETVEGVDWYQVVYAGRIGWVAAGDEGNWLARVTNGRIATTCLRCTDDGGLVTVSVDPNASNDVSVMHPAASRVTWSPDGRRWTIETTDPNTGAFELLLADASGGGPLSLGAATAPTWSPDGERLAYVLPSDGTMFLLPIDGTPRAVASLSHGSPGSIAWSPDGTRIAFAAIDCPACPVGEPIAGDPPISVFVVDLASGETRKLADGGNAGQLQWSPDGSALTYLELDLGSGALELRLVDAATSQVRVVLEGAEIGFGHAFSPDGTKVALGTPDGIVVADVDGSAPEIVLAATADTNPHPRNPRWSPDGQWILFDRVWITGDAVEAWIIRPDGSGERLIAELGYDAAWQPRLEPLR